MTDDKTRDAESSGSQTPTDTEPHGTRDPHTKATIETPPDEHTPDVTTPDDGEVDDVDLVTPEGRAPEDESSGRVVVASPRGVGIAEQHGDKDPTSIVEEPAKVMRLGSMIKQLLEEVRSAPLDDAARERMARIHERSVEELESGLSPELVDELHRITLPFTEDQTPSDAELRIAQAQLVGWLEGLFHGIQTALVAQQMAAQNQLAQMRKALPPGSSQMPPGLIINRPGEESDRRGTGQYL